MAIQSIAKSAFELKKLSEEGYELKINFQNQQGSVVSSKVFTFIQGKGVQKGEILDIYSQNGQCGKRLFSKRDAQGIETSGLKIQNITPSGPILLVLDLKDSQHQYLKIDEITQHEQAVCDFFGQGFSEMFMYKHAKKIQSIVNEKLYLDFILLEGRLKNTLLQPFSDSEAEYWQNSKQGSIEYCQLAEFFMNAFKLGQQVNNMSGQEYFQPLHKKLFQPCSKSTVWYPLLYKDIYSPEGSFAKTLSAICSVTGVYDEGNKITTLTMESGLCNIT